MNDAETSPETPWQLKLSLKSIKKRQKLDLLGRLVPESAGLECLEMGTETGVVTYFLRTRKGGKWIAGTLKPRWTAECNAFLKTDVVELDTTKFPFKDASLDAVLCSRPEHVQDDRKMFQELYRILKPGGRFFLTSPHDAPGLFLNRVKKWVGLSQEAYDHFRDGYEAKSLTAMLEGCGFKDVRCGSYCRFFSESIELALNAVYVRINRRKQKRAGEGAGHPDEYRPTTEAEVGQVGGAMKAYNAVFPILLAFSKLDLLIPFTRGYVIWASARK